MRSKGTSRQSILRRYIAAPKRFLAKARDFYVRNMIELDGKVSYGSSMVMPCPIPPVSGGGIPGREFFAGSKRGENDEKSMKKLPLIRPLQRNCFDGNDEDEGGKERCEDRIIEGFMLGRCYSVGVGSIGRIDEDEPCFFRREEIITKSEILFPTCRR